MLTYALCLTESAFCSMLKYWPLYSIAVGNNSDTETLLVISCQNPVLPGSFSVKYGAGEKISHSSAIEVSSLNAIKLNST